MSTNSYVLRRLYDSNYFCCETRGAPGELLLQESVSQRDAMRFETIELAQEKALGLAERYSITFIPVMWTERNKI